MSTIAVPSPTTDAPAPLANGRYAVDPATSSVRFSVTHFGLQTVHGTLGGLRGAVMVAAGRLAATGSVESSTIRTGTPRRDAHLRSPGDPSMRSPR